MARYINYIINTAGYPVIAISISTAAISGKIKVFIGIEISLPATLMIAISSADNGRPWKFDTKIPILTQDEIGELAIAFNQMGKQLKFHITALNQEKEHLSNILSSMADGVITINIDGTILMTNPPAERFLQAWYYEQNMKIKDGDELPPEARELFHTAVSTEKEQMIEVTLQGRTWVLLMSPLYNQQDVRGAVAVLRDMTEERRLDKLRKDFIANVSHELRTPLTTVRMAADLIYDHSDDLEPALRRSTELMVSELDRFESLLSDLLEISRHDAGVAELSVESVDLRSTVESALDDVGHLAKDADVDLIVDLPGEHVIAEVDPRRVERILRNLIANAIDHAERKPVRIRMAADDDTVAVTVRDYGVGLRPGEEKLVFSRFWRSDPSRVRRSGGTVLGLAISIEDARLHQGRLEAWGEPGNGACFRLTLPLVRGHKVTTSPLPLKPIAPERNGRTPSAQPRSRETAGKSQ